MFDETIAAIATPLGQGGLAIIRISGDKALPIADSLFAPGGKSKTQLTKAKSHTLHYGHVIRDDCRLDEVMVSVMKAPATFTRETVVEISCHGGIRSTKAVLDAVLDAGALVDHVTLLNTMQSFAFVFELCPTIQDHHELKVAVVYMPLLHLVRICFSVSSDHMCNIVSLCRVLYSKVAVLKNIAQAWRPFSLVGSIVSEFPVLRHVFLP